MNEEQKPDYVKTVNLKSDVDFMRSVNDDPDREILKLNLLLQRKQEEHLSTIKLYVAIAFWLMIISALLTIFTNYGVFSSGY